MKSLKNYSIIIKKKRVMKDGMWGFINTSEEMIIEPVFEDAMYFMAGGSVYAKRDGVWRMISLYYNNDD